MTDDEMARAIANFRKVLEHAADPVILVRKLQTFGEPGARLSDLGYPVIEHPWVPEGHVYAMDRARLRPEFLAKGARLKEAPVFTNQILGRFPDGE